MYREFLETAAGRTTKSTIFLLILCIVIPLALFTQMSIFIDIAWLMSIILGVFIFISGLVTIQEGYCSKKWPKIEINEFECLLDIHRSSHNSIQYSPKVNCVFELDGIVYTGTQYDLSSIYGSRTSAEKKLDKLRNVKSFDVYYKPSDPNINVIHPGIQLVHFLRIILGPAISIICFLYWTGYLKIVS